jgi:hypothetical protein
MHLHHIDVARVSLFENHTKEPQEHVDIERLDSDYDSFVRVSSGFVDGLLVRHCGSTIEIAHVVFGDRCRLALLVLVLILLDVVGRSSVVFDACAHIHFGKVANQKVLLDCLRFAVSHCAFEQTDRPFRARVARLRHKQPVSFTFYAFHSSKFF